MALRPLPEPPPEIAKALLRLPASDYKIVQHLADRHGRSINFVLARLVEHGINLPDDVMATLLGEPVD